MMCACAIPRGSSSVSSVSSVQYVIVGSHIDFSNCLSSIPLRFSKDTFRREGEEIGIVFFLGGTASVHRK